MKYKPILCLCLLSVLSIGVSGQAHPDSLSQPTQSRVLHFAESDGGETTRAVVNLLIHDEFEETVLGATALLQRKDPASVHGKISQWDGRCQFKVSPGMYDLKIQLTGMVTFERTALELLPGRQYDMEIEMVRMRPPVPSAKQQAGKN